MHIIFYEPYYDTISFDVSEENHQTINFIHQKDPTAFPTLYYNCDNNASMSSKNATTFCCCLKDFLVQ